MALRVLGAVRSQQVVGVDEADIVKTDGKYIYVMARNSLYLAQAYPAESARILAQISVPNSRSRRTLADTRKGSRPVVIRVVTVG